MNVTLSTTFLLIISTSSLTALFGVHAIGSQVQHTQSGAPAQLTYWLNRLTG
ncbi:hypothetical protein LZ3411_1730 [Levilactobacillus zymae]|uniref:Uncharacterized protein n=1 Tax=Levilactobacillus zymae TaxID=267363 RepID=A0A1Y6JYA4_9LACO|nr:hypothetical protein LZ3411_1730 [Levilactobacillus zymae]